MPKTTGEARGRIAFRVYLDPADAATVRQIAREQDSSLARMLRVLIRESLDNRKEQNGKRN